MKAKDAEELMSLVNKNEEAKVQIKILLEQHRWVNTAARTPTCQQEEVAEQKGSSVTALEISRHVSREGQFRPSVKCCFSVKYIRMYSCGLDTNEPSSVEKRGQEIGME